MMALEQVFRQELSKEYRRGFLHGSIYGIAITIGIYLLFFSLLSFQKHSFFTRHGFQSSSVWPQKTGCTYGD